MTFPSLAILTRVREVLEDGRGAVRTITAETYKPGTHAALDALSDSVGALGKPTIEATIADRVRHPSSPARQGSFTLEEITVSVRVVRGFDGNADLNAAARTALHSLAASDGFDISQALGWPGNMTATEAASATGLVSGQLQDLGTSVASLEYPSGQNGRLVTTHRFRGVVRVETPIPDFATYLTTPDGDRLITPDGDFLIAS